MSFADRLNRKLKGKNVAQVARELGIPKSVLHDWAQAEHMPSMSNIAQLKKLADYFSLTLEELLLGETKSDLVSAHTYEENGSRYRIKVERIK